MTEFAVELRDVVKRFPNPGGGEISAVNHVTLQIKNGEFFSLLGPSGCGKTTTLRMVAGFEWPTEGEILYQQPGDGTYSSLLTPSKHSIPKLCTFPAHDDFSKRCLWIGNGKSAKN